MSLTLAAAPAGARVGFTAVGGPTAQLLLTVAPKAWRTDPRRVIAVSSWPEARHQQVTMFETDRLHVTAPEPEMDDLLTRCLLAARQTRGDQGLWDSALLTPEVAPRPTELVNPRTLATDDPVTTTDLLTLFDRLELLTPQAEDLTGRPRRSPLHRPLLYRRFLDELFTVINHARRGYRPVTTTRTSIRGRVEAASALRHLSTGDPRLVCHYEELTESTLLLGIICAALEWIAHGRGIRSPFGGRFAETSLRHNAVTLRRRLVEVTATHPRTALTAGPRLHLNRLDRPWKTARDLALAVLAETEPVPEHATSLPTDPIELSIGTDKLWERIVHQVLLRSGFTRVLDQQAQPIGMVVDPWLSPRPSTPDTRPDNVASRGQATWIVDAKYKIPEQGAAPNRDDQYQMFAYSHLVDDPLRPVRFAALVYPGRGPLRVWSRGRDPAEPPVRLLTISVPFPTPTDVRTPLRWESYLDAATVVCQVHLASIDGT